MLNKDQIRQAFEQLELKTVSDSFGGPAVSGRAPDFNFFPIMEKLTVDYRSLDPETISSINVIKDKLENDALEYVIKAAGRFAYCIELTNLSITSTKNKTRWIPGKIIKTRPESFQNYQGLFKPYEDARSATFNECFDIFSKVLKLLSQSKEHLNIIVELSKTKNRGVPYESVFTYETFSTNRIHIEANIKLTDLEDITWLINTRPIVYPVLSKDASGNSTKVVDKIKTKVYKTDRAQTGEVQTNRAKRWECLPLDFQHASLEECWSVERKLLSDICNFENFPSETKSKLVQKELLVTLDNTRCPITLKPLNFSELLNGGSHGKSMFQVGHLDPLKSGGKHIGSNIAWISDDGNRIQGSLSIKQTRIMLTEIVDRMREQSML
jgi:hypothetical protein